MKRHQPGNAGVLCERARLRSGEMAPFGGEPGVLVQECRLDEELVGAETEIDEQRGIRKGIIGAVCPPADSRMPPQSAMFTEPKAWTQRLSPGQHCGAWNT
jgi:hypothetical protein